MAGALLRPSSVESVDATLTSALSSLLAGEILQDSPKGSDTHTSDVMLTRIFSSETPTSNVAEIQPPPAQTLKPTTKKKKKKKTHKKIAKSLAKFVQKAPAPSSASKKKDAKVTVPVKTEDESDMDPEFKWTCKALKKKITNLEMPSLLHTCFFTINVIMFGLGMAGFVVGLIALSDKGELAGVESNMDFGGIFEKVASILIPIGLVFITLGVLGAAGVATQNPQLLLYYAMIMGGILAIEALAAVSVFANRSKIEKDISKQLIETMKTEYDGKQNSTKFFSLALDFAQYFFGCCGIEGLGDFKGSSWYNRVNKNFIATPLTKHTTTTTQSYKTTTTTNKNTTTKPEPERLHDFPISCCKSRYFSILTSLDNLDSVKLDNLDCYSHDASDRNLHTLEPCVQAVNNFLYSQVLTILSLTFTFVGLEMSAASNAYSMSKEIEEKLKEERQENEDEDEDAEAEAEAEAEGDTRI